MSTTVKWRFNYLYFYLITQTYSTDKTEQVIQEFCNKYRCVRIENGILVNTNEDFLVIKLIEPNAIMHVVNE